MVRRSLQRFQLRAYRGGQRPRQPVGLLHRRVVGREEVEVVGLRRPSTKPTSTPPPVRKKPLLRWASARTRSRCKALRRSVSISVL